MYIITGGAGFMGSALIWELNRQGITQIHVVDNLGHSEKWKNLVGLQYEEYIHRDVFIERVRKGKLDNAVDGIVHLGACSSTTETDAEFLMHNNFAYTRDLCQAALKSGVRFVNASSAATYGDGSRGFDDDIVLMPRWRPMNMYGYSKHLFDLWLWRNHVYDRVVSLKFFNVYGPNEYHKGDMRSVVCKAYDEILQTGSLRLFRSDSPLYPDGGQMRDFVYIKDCTKMLAWLLLNTHVNGIYNVGTGKARTWNDLAAAIFSAMSLPVNVEYIDMPEHLRGKYQNFTQAQVERLLKHDCPASTYDLETGVTEYVQKYLCNHAYLDSI